MVYRPVDYWERRGRKRDNQRHDREELDNLVSWVKDISPGSILEIGSGWGAIYQVLGAANLVGNFTMCDFVDSLRRNCKKWTGVLPDAWDGRTLPYGDAAFDLVLTFRVLLHVPHDDIVSFLAEEVRVCKRWIFAATLREWHKPLEGGHCFVHDYAALFMRLGLTVERERQFGVDSHWLLRKKENCG